jgi:hypothetical protein
VELMLRHARPLWTEVVSSNLGALKLPN